MAPRSEHRTYWSRRGVALVYGGQPQQVPVLTVENSIKWYGLELVMPDGSVREVGFRELQSTADERRTFPFVDHVPDPTVVAAFAEHMGWHVDAVSYELMVGRWETEIMCTPKYDR